MTASTRIPERLTRLFLATGLCAGAALLSACRSGPPGPKVPPSFEVDGNLISPRDYGLVLLRTGESPPALDRAASEEAFAGHFAFMGAIAEEGKLLVAGPFGQVKAADDLRGLFLIDAEDPAVAAEIAGGDPTTQMGVFRQEVFPLTTLDILRFLPALYEAEEAAHVASGGDPAEPVLRPYCVLMAADGKRLSDLLDTPVLWSKIVLLGRLGGAREGHAFAILDVESASVARSYMTAAAGGFPVEVELSEWYASPALAKLGADGPPPAGEAQRPRIESSK